MEHSILGFPEYTSAANWRRRDQLRGLLRNHADVVAASTPLAAPGNIFTSAQIALHDTERALAVAISPFIGAGSVGLMAIDADPQGPGLAGAARMRWLDLSGDVKTSSVAWCDELLLLGSSRGRILVADLPVDSCEDSSGLLQPCGALVTDLAAPPLGQIAVSSCGHAATTLVRSVSVNTKVSRTSVLGTCGTTAYMWDLAGEATPVRSWAPHTDADSSAALLFARWAPGSDRVVLTGDYTGAVVLTDTRGAQPARNGLVFPLRDGYMATSADFNAVMPFVFAAASSDGTISVFDVRHTTAAVHTIPSLQGNVSALRWLRLQSDTLVTGGTDGSVSLWNMRQPPTYCVGRAQFSFPFTDLAATETFLEQRAYGVTIGGELTATGLRTEAMAALCPPLGAAQEGATPASSSARGGDDAGLGGSKAELADGHGDPAQDLSREATNVSFGASFAAAPTDRRTVALEAAEQQACGHLYTRRLREAFALLSDCASERFARKDTARALELVSMIDVNRTPVLDYNAFMEDKSRTVVEEGAGADSPAKARTSEEGRQAYELQLLRTTARLCTTVPLDRIRDLEKPDPQHLRTLESLRLNTLLHRVLLTQDARQVAGGVRQALELLSAHPESLELIDADVVAAIVSLLLRKDFVEGEGFVRAMLSFLEQASTGKPPVVALFRRVLTAVQEPLLTGDLRTRAARRYEENFFQNLPAAKDAVLTQLEIQRLGVERYQEVIAVVNAYLGRCRKLRVPDMFTWLGIKSVILFLECLSADSNYVTFFWTCVQCIEAWASFPRVHQVEEVLLDVVGRIRSAAEKITADLDDLADLDRFSVPLLRQVDNTLHTTHSFLTVLLRVQFENENVALRGSMPEMPPVMAKIQQVLNSAAEDVLDAWASVIDALIDCGQAEVVRKYCLGSVRDFSFGMEDLMDVSAKGEGDERLNEILDVCDDFLDTVGKRH